MNHKLDISRLLWATSSAIYLRSHPRYLFLIALLWVLGEAYYLYRQYTFDDSLVAVGVLDDDAQSKKGRIQLGVGFKWKPTHTQRIHSISMQDGLPIDNDSRTNIFHAVGRPKPVDMSTVDLSGHMAIHGKTGSGKSNVMFKLMQQCVAQDDGPIIGIDPKETQKLIPYARYLAKLTGRPYYEVNVMKPDQTLTLDPLSTCTNSTQIKDRILSLMSDTREPFFKDFPTGILERVAYMMGVVDEWWTLDRLYRNFMFMDYRIDLLKRYLAAKKVDCEGELSVVDMAERAKLAGLNDTRTLLIIKDLLGIDGKQLRDTEWLERVTANLDSSLGSIVTSSISDVLKRDKNSISWQRIADEKAILMIVTGSTAAPNASEVAANLIFQDLQGFFAARYASSDPSSFHPVYTIVDEFAAIVYPEFLRQLSQCREAGARYILGWQSEAQTVSRLSPAMSAELMSNLSTLITLAINDEASQKRLSELFGPCYIKQSGESATIDPGTQGRGVSGRLMRNQSYQNVQLIQSNWLGALPPGHGYMRLNGTLFKVQFPFMAK